MAGSNRSEGQDGQRRPGLPVAVAAGSDRWPGSGAGPARRLAGLLRALAWPASVLALWQAVILLLAPPAYMLPGPAAVAAAGLRRADDLLQAAAITGLEVVLGLAVGCLAGMAAGLAVASHRGIARILMPVLLVLQAMPVFALAPVLVLWLGFGIASKVAMAAIIIAFPVASALADGLSRTDPGLLDLARLSGAGRLATLRLIRLPAALPSLSTGLRMAATLAPIGAVIGEWVGAAGGLGLMMLEANARMQSDVLFAALALLAAATLALRAAADHLTRRLVHWIDETA